MYFNSFAHLIVVRLQVSKMWFENLDGTSYVLMLSLLVIFTVFALIVFGSLPGCNCKYLLRLDRCFKIRNPRVADSSRSHVVGSGVIDPEGLPHYPGMPLAFGIGRERLEGANMSPFESPRRMGVTLLTLSPMNLSYGQGGSRFKQGWDEPPPSYDSLFPIEMSSISKEVEKSVSHSGPSSQTQITS